MLSGHKLRAARYWERDNIHVLGRQLGIAPKSCSKFACSTELYNLALNRSPYVWGFQVGGRRLGHATCLS